MKKIRILFSDNGVGLTKDAQLLTRILKDSGYYVSHYTGDFNGYHAEEADLNIHLEIVYQGFLKANKGKNVMIPNPEWFFMDWKRWLNKYDSILCKTKDAETIFKRLGLKTQYVSFTSEDRHDPLIMRDSAFAHFAGQSLNKGTEETILAFIQDDMPPLNLYSMRPYRIKERKDRPSKISLHQRRLSDGEMKQEQNRHMFHICCSTYEGFGHYINEAKSCGAIIITTNAPPMNELVTAEFGMGVSVRNWMKQNLAMTARPNVSSLASQVLAIKGIRPEQATSIRARVRESFLANDKFFKERFPNVVYDMIGN